MDIVIDTSALIAVIAGEPERDRILAITEGKSLTGPGSIPWEIGNAFSAMFKQNRLPIDQAHKRNSNLREYPDPIYSSGLFKFHHHSETN